MKEIIVLFKTHLDIGFTDFAHTVMERYMTEYIPRALEVARALRGSGEGFVWTVGSLLVQEYLERAGNGAREMEEAIGRGEIRWHGLPCTTHTELMDEGLFRYGLSLSQKLDRRFGTKTRSAKMTDVPGHTRAMIPYLAEAGIEFLHIGVNPASTVPDVPALFRWRDISGREITVMYQRGYGDFAPIGNSGRALYFAHTGDNHGPQDPEHIWKVYEELHEKYPGVRIRAGSLEDVAAVARTLTDLPVVTEEIGDSWIHGVGSDPGKVSVFRSLLRLAGEMPEQDRESLYRQLLFIPEHTWGLDEKTHLGHNGVGEHRYFVRKEFEAVRSGERFRKMEESWQEQRDYLREGIRALGGNWRLLGGDILAARKGEFPDLQGFQAVSGEISLEEYRICFDQNGALEKLVRGEKVLADKNHLWGQVSYEVFSQMEYDRFYRQYVTCDAQWAVEDFGKVGIDSAVPERLSVRPGLTGIYRKGREIVCLLEFTGVSHTLYGAPGSLTMRWEFLPEAVSLELLWRDKPATRAAEALWLRFRPMEKLRGIRKLSQWIDPLQVVEKGGRSLHATDWGVRFDSLRIACRDCALVGPGASELFAFSGELPDPEDGTGFLLYNNVWGTNFVMWYEEDARFRFRMDWEA